MYDLRCTMYDERCTNYELNDLVPLLLPLGGVRRGALLVLDSAVVGAGHTLHFLAVLVVAGNLYAGLCQFVLQLGVGSEDD